MADFTSILFAWNDWVIFPVLVVAALVLHIRRRKPSTRTLFVGLLVFSVGRVLLMAYAQSPLHTGYIIGLVVSSFGLVAAMAGGVWFLRKDYVVSSKQA